MSSIKPFTISISDSALEKLRQKLALAQFPDELDEAAWDYGSPLSDVNRLTQYWKDKFDWRKQEERLNQLPQFTTQIQVDGFDPLQIHFVHQQSNVRGAIPLLFVHGCMFSPRSRIAAYHRV